MRTAVLAAVAVAFLLPVGDVLAQETDTDVPQTFWFEIGGFRVSSNTDLVLNASNPDDDVNFERDLNLPNTTTQGYLEFFWRPWNRHQFSLNWQRVQRDGGTLTLERDIEWGGETFPLGVEVTGTNDTDFLSAAYRWSVYKNDKFEIGPALGLGYIWIDASLSGRVRVGDFDLGGVQTVRGSASSITGDVGGFFYWWPGRRWMARGDFRYIAVGLDDADAAIAEGRASLTWYPWSRFGIGLQYAYTSVEYKRGVTITELGGKIQYDGIQILGSIAF